jgi:hypothetical protein
MANPPSLPLKILGIAAAALLASSAFMTLQAVNSSPWFSFTNDSGDFNLSLLSCQDCPDQVSSWTTDCFKATACKADSASEWCSQWSKADGAGNVVYYMAYASLLCTVFLAERVVCSLMRKFTGKRLVAYVLAVTSSVLQVVSVAQWFVVTGTQFRDNCSVQGDDALFCAKQGSIIAICAAIVNSLGCGLAVLHLNLTASCEGPMFDIEGRRKFLSTKVIPMILITLGLEVFGLNWHWTYYEEDVKRHNFITYNESYEDYDNFGHNCIASAAIYPTFDTIASKRECKAFERLYEAGELLKQLRLAEYMFLGLWLECLVYMSNNKEFGLSCLHYVWPVSMTLTQVVALVAWTVKSGAGFSNNCQVLQLDTAISFCSDTSVILAILAIIVNGLSLAAFFIVFVNRYDSRVTGGVVYDETSIQKQLYTKSSPDKVDDDTFERSSTNLSELYTSTVAPDSRVVTAVSGRRLPCILPIESLSLTMRSGAICSLCSAK